MEFPRWLDPRRIYQNPGRIFNPLGVRGGLIYGTAADIIGEQLNLPKEDRAAIQGALMAPIPALMPLAGMIGYDLNRPVGPTDEEEREMVRKALEEDRKRTRLARGIPPDAESVEVRPGTVVGRDGAMATLSETPPEPLRPGIDVDPTPTVRPRVEPRQEQRPLDQTTTPTTVAREKVPAASSPVPAVATGGNPNNEVEAVERQAVSELDNAMAQLGSFEDIQSDRLRAALQGAQEDILMRRFG